ncbi:hypothetical protein KJ680_03705 [bacterium]|nr:hypothetical protein [bacterium]
MTMNTYVDQILDSPAHVFDGIIEQLIGRNFYNSKIELKRHVSDVDAILFEAIKSILKDLREEEGIVSRFFYNVFGVELRKNKRRAQLIFLGSELKTQHSKVKSELFRIHRLIERLRLTIIDLKRLEEGFRAKNIYFQSEIAINKSKYFIREIEANIFKLKECQISLESKHNSLGDIEKIYNSLFKKIPRYHELQEESHLRLLPSVPKRN